VVTDQTCLYCGKPFKGRTDKKFCGEECKNNYHNPRKLEEAAEIKKIKLALIRNQRIIKALLAGRPEIIVTRETLLKKGFEFDYHTHHVTSKTKRNEYIFSFNYGYHDLGTGQYKLVKSF